MCAEAKRPSIEVWDLVREIRNRLQVTWMFLACSLYAENCGCILIALWQNAL